MPAYAGCSCAGGLVDVDLLDGLARGGGIVLADGVVEDHDFLDTGEILAEEGFDFGVVAFADGFVVGELCFFGWGVVQGETGFVGGEIGFVAADVGDGVVVVVELEGVAWSINLGPWL